jgi:hypothetical protein
MKVPYTVHALQIGLIIAVSVLILVSPVMAQPFTGGDAPRVVVWSPDGNQVAMGYHNGRVESVDTSSPPQK